MTTIGLLMPPVPIFYILEIKINALLSLFEKRIFMKFSSGLILLLCSSFWLSSCQSGSKKGSNQSDSTTAQSTSQEHCSPTSKAALMGNSKQSNTDVNKNIP